MSRARAPVAVTLMAAALMLSCGPAPQEPPALAPEPDIPSPAPAAAPLAGGALGSLRLGEGREGVLPAGGAYDYLLELAEGDAFLVEAGQDEVDLEVEILGPAGESLIRFDSPVARNAPERLCQVASAAGLYTIRLRPWGETGGAFTLRLERLRPATAADRDCHRAARLFADAEARRSEEGASIPLATEYERAQALWRSAGEALSAAISLRRSGDVRRNLGRNAEAADSYRRALVSAREAATFDPDVSSLESSVRNRLGLALLDLGDLAGAEEALRPALARARETGDRAGEASALHNLARVDETAGETHRAIERYQEVLPIWSELGNDVQLAQTWMSLADAYALLDHHRDALHLLADAERVCRANKYQERLAHVLVSTGWVHHLRGRPGDAIAPFREALELYRALGNRDGEAATLDRLGTALRETGNFASALDAYRASLALSEVAGSLKDAANTALNVGCLFQEWGRTDEAREHLASARERLRKVEDPKARSHVEYCQARLEHREGDLEAALEALERALAVVDELRGAARKRGARYRPIWLWQDYAELHLELLMAQARATGEQRFAVRAFEASDLARARNLFELVLESLVGVRTSAPQALIDAERDVQKRLNAAQKARRERKTAGAPASELTALERRLGELSLELERARDRIRAADPRFAELAAPRPVRLDELQGLLDPGTVLLSVALGAERSYLFAVGRDSFESWPLAPRKVIDAQAQALHEALRQSRFHPYQVVLAARGLGEMLLPAGALPAEASRLLVVADGMLHYVPMAVLPSPRDGDGGRSVERLLADDFEIRYLPSASVLTALGGRGGGRPRWNHLLAVFADAVFSDIDPRLRPVAGPSDLDPAATATQRLLQGPLPRLPHTAREAEAILDLVGEGLHSQAFLGFDATKQAVIQGRADSFQILHFATHALIDERFPELSGLVLSRRDRAGSALDGDLHLHEIYGLRLAAEMVVLSGCQTALGQRVRGDGLVSLARGFLYAGASQLLVSLWSVDDEATAELMAELYRGILERGESSVTALRSAQLRMRGHERWDAPYYWAGFVLQSAVP